MQEVCDGQKRAPKSVQVSSPIFGRLKAMSIQGQLWLMLDFPFRKMLDFQLAQTGEAL
jgi:hypothetical protein